jgi:hypothetical protein
MELMVCRLGGRADENPRVMAVTQTWSNKTEGCEGLQGSQWLPESDAATRGRFRRQRDHQGRPKLWSRMKFKRQGHIKINESVNMVLLGENLVATLWRWGSRGRRTSLNLKPSSALTSI